MAAAQRLCAVVWKHLADSSPAVILPRPAVLAPSATTWYVTLCEEPIPRLRRFRRNCRGGAPQRTNSHTDETTVPLASNDHGSCTYNAQSALNGLSLDEPRSGENNCENKANIINRATHHTPAVSSSSQSTSLPTTPSSPRRSTSPPASTTPTSTRTEASVWTFCETSGARRSPLARVRMPRQRLFKNLILTRCSAAQYLFHADRPQPRRPARPRDCTRLQDRPLQVRVDSPGMDSQVRHLESALRCAWGGFFTVHDGI
jgi:hypothetical protein